MGKTLEGFKKHAERYGTEGVAETGAEIGLKLSELTELIVHIDKLDQASKPRITQRRRKVDVHAIAEARARKLLGLDDEPLEAA